MKAFLENAASVGAVVAAAACPVCFPKLALVGALFGLGAFSAYEAQLFLAAQALVIIAMIGHALTYLRRRNGWLLTGGLVSGAAVFAGLHWAGSEMLAYAGLGGLVAASALELWLRRRRSLLESVMTCPQCGARSKETMPPDACQFFYDCRSCGAVLRPKKGDCCVFCSYGSVRCPTVQSAGAALMR